ncbi:MAG TPA: YciI family protein [Gammaproteobacteria bacterium]
MQFLLMCCTDEKNWMALPEGERAAIMNDYGRWVDAHVASGHYVTGGKLDESHAATTVRERNGKLRVMDGPFSEAKEQIGGYHVIECADRDEAIAIAQQIPTLRAGSSVEVRPLLFRTG